MSKVITSEELESLNRAVLLRYGIDFTCYEPKSLMRRVQRSLSVFKIDSISELWLRCLKEQNFIHLLVNELTVGMTSLFRDPLLWKSIRDKALPILDRKDKIDMWHAGCSTGEEVYTMSIITGEAGMAKKFNTHASDINQHAIKIAKKGKYHQLNLADFEKNYLAFNPEGFLDRYFDWGHNKITFSKKLIKNVQFEYHNLVTEKPKRNYDIVFCRNVMIYFDDGAKAKLLQKIYDCLNPGGFFVIGFYDSLMPFIEKTPFTFFDRDAKIFQKLLTNK